MTWRTTGRGLPLRWRLALIYALVLGAALAVALTSVQLLVERALIDSTAQRLEVEAGLIAARNGNGAVSTTTRTAADLARALGGQETAVVILDSGGTTLAAEANGAQPWVVDARLDSVDYQSVITDRQIVDQVVAANGDSGARVLLVAAPIRFEAGESGSSGGPPFVPPGQAKRGASGNGNNANRPAVTGPPNAVAQLSVSLGGVEATLANLRATSVVVGVLAFLAALAVALVVTTMGLRPLGRVAAAADHVAHGDLAARADLPIGADEVGRLGRAFDDMAAQVERAFAAQRQFAADASHELRTPLTVLGGYVDVLKAGALDAPETAGRILESMRREIDRLSRLAADLLLLTQLEAGGGRLSPTDLDAAELLADVAEAGTVMDGQRRVEADVREELPVRVDRDRLTQALLNLVDNAVGHTPPDGQVRLLGRREDSDVVLEVHNQGAPIPPEHLPRLFDRFYRVDRSREPGRHAGLGLAIVKAIVQASGGTVGAWSDAAGTRFVIRLPAQERPLFSAPSQRSSSAPTAGGDRVIIEPMTDQRPTANN